MINPFKEVNWQPDTSARRKFAVSLIIGFPCLGLVLFLGRGLINGAWNPGLALKLGGIGLGAGIVFLLLPAIARPFYLAWFFVSCCIGIVVSNLLMALFYFVLLTPIGLLVRAFGRSAVQKGFKREAVTYWEAAPKSRPAKSYYQQF